MVWILLRYTNLLLCNKKEKVLIPANLTREKKTYEISINRVYLRNAVAMIAAVILFFAFSNRVENTDIQKNNYAQLLPGELFEQIEKQSVVVTPVSVKSRGTQQQVQKTSAPKITVDKAKTSRPIAVKEVKSTSKKQFLLLSLLNHKQISIILSILL